MQALQFVSRFQIHDDLSGRGECIECDGWVGQAQTHMQASIYVLVLCAGP